MYWFFLSDCLNLSLNSDRFRQLYVLVLLVRLSESESEFGQIQTDSDSFMYWFFLSKCLNLSLNSDCLSLNLSLSLSLSLTINFILIIQKFVIV